MGIKRRRGTGTREKISHTYPLALAQYLVSGKSVIYECPDYVIIIRVQCSIYENIIVICSSG